MAFLSRYSCFVLSTAIIISLLVSETSCSSASTSREAYKSDDNALPLHGLKPDPFVSASPLVVAAVCADGVAILATHTASINEPLLLEQDSEEIDSTSSLEDRKESDVGDVTNSSDATLVKQTFPRDLPMSYRGPFRIYMVDGFGTTLTCAGWRTDGDLLATKSRALAASYVDRYGEPAGGQEYGRYLAQEASLWMAQCAVSESVRALSCVGLLSSSGENVGPGYLWLVDATGVYAVRAHAIGLGAKNINGRLRTVDFSSMTKEKCIVRLLELICMEPTEKESADWSLQKSEARVELAVVDSSLRKMKRLRQPFVIPRISSS